MPRRSPPALASLSRNVRGAETVRPATCPAAGTFPPGQRVRPERTPGPGRVPGPALSHRGWHAGRRRSSSPSCCCEAAVCTYWGSGDFCGDETMPRGRSLSHHAACRAVPDGRAVGALPAQGTRFRRRTAGGLLAVPRHQFRAQPQGDADHRIRNRLRPPPGGHGPKYQGRPVHHLHSRRPQLPDRASPLPVDAPAPSATGPRPGQGLLRSDRSRLPRRKLRRLIPPDRPSP
jgi:hypothetical protein